MKRRFLALFFFLLSMSAVAMSEYTAQQYIDDVTSGRVVVCKWVRLAVERHLRDLKRAEEGDPDFPYYFDEAQAKRIIDFTQQLHHTQGEWANPRLHNPYIRLEPWQQFIDWVLFGWRKKDSGYRRFTKSYIEEGRKNGKTVQAAATANYCFLVDSPREVGPEVFHVATKKEQARDKPWKEAMLQIKKHPFLKSKTRIYTGSSNVIVPGTAAFMRPLGRDSSTEDAWNPHFVLVDEYHAHPDNSMLAVMQSGMIARKQPLLYIITTAGFDKNSPCYQEEHTIAEQILERRVNPVPEHIFCIIYTLDEGDDWTDRNVWIKANPNLGISIGWEELENEVKEALISPRKQNRVKTKNLNIWTQAESRWITAESWDACAFPVDPEELIGRKCVMGLDLSTSKDITAEVLCFPPIEKDEKYKFLFRFFIPEENMLERERKDKVPYSLWVEQGLVFATPGPTINDDFIERQIFKDAEKYQVEEIAFDPFKAQVFVNHLTDEGFTMVEMRQGFYTMAGPTDTFERKILAKEIAHDNHPIMAWMVSCTEVRSDNKGLFIPIKPKREISGKRIDGVVASIMALGRGVLLVESGHFVNDPTPPPAAAGMRDMEF